MEFSLVLISILLEIFNLWIKGFKNITVLCELFIIIHLLLSQILVLTLYFSYILLDVLFRYEFIHYVWS